MSYFKIRKCFKFLEEYGYKIEYKSIFGYIQVSYINEKKRIKILGGNEVKILISSAQSLGTIYDVMEYSGCFSKNKGKNEIHNASEWLKKYIDKNKIDFL